MSRDFLNSKIFGIKWSRLLLNSSQTLYMVGWALLIGTMIGLALALLLVLTRRGGVLRGRVARLVYAIVNVYVNIVRSVPFVILLVTIMPLTRALIGTTIGSTAALVIYISPYLARLIENSFLECSPGILEAAQAMGATPWQMIRYFLIPETLGSVVLALTTGTIWTGRMPLAENGTRCGGFRMS